MHNLIEKFVKKCHIIQNTGLTQSNITTHFSGLKHCAEIKATIECIGTKLIFTYTLATNQSQAAQEDSTQISPN